MRKLFLIVILAVFTISVNAQEKKSKTKTTQQHRSAKTGRYVTKSETKKSPSTTYTTTRKRK